MGRGTSKAGSVANSRGELAGASSKMTITELFTKGGRVGASEAEEAIYSRSTSTSPTTQTQINRNATLRNLQQQLDDAPVGTTLNYDTTRLGDWYGAEIYEKVEHYGQPVWQKTTYRRSGAGVSSVRESETYDSRSVRFVSLINSRNYADGLRRVTNNVMQKYDEDWNSISNSADPRIKSRRRKD